MITREFQVGDRLTSLLADLYTPCIGAPNGRKPVILELADTVAFRMVLVNDGTVKVNNQPAVIVTRGSAATNTPAQVRYDWVAADVNAAGEYVGWFIRTSGGLTEHFPSQDPDDPQFKIIFYETT